MINKIMSVIKNVFKSADDRNVEYFHLGDSANDLNEKGFAEFTRYIYLTGDATKAGFLAKLAERKAQIKEEE